MDVLASLHSENGIGHGVASCIEIMFRERWVAVEE